MPDYTLIFDRVIGIKFLKATLSSPTCICNTSPWSHFTFWRIPPLKFSPLRLASIKFERMYQLQLLYKCLPVRSRTYFWKKGNLKKSNFLIKFFFSSCFQMLHWSRKQDNQPSKILPILTHPTEMMESTGLQPLITMGQEIVAVSKHFKANKNE